jgi:F420-non-reducing hydrogenase iron-sulfur subunit
MAVLGNMLGYLGLDRRRFRLEWVSAGEGARFAEVVSQFTEQVRELGPQKGWASAV